MNRKIRFHHLFTYPFYRQKDVFSLFDFGLPKVILYFIVLNLVMLFPLSLSIIRMDEPDLARFGIDVHEDPPAWIPYGLPEDCVVTNQRLDCDTEEVFIYTIENRGTVYEVHFNVPDDVTIDDPHTIVFKQTVIEATLAGGVSFTFDYSGFESLDFADLHEMEQETAAEILFNSLWRSVHPHLVLPLIILSVGGILLTNIVLLVILASLGMLFKLLNHAVPSYPNMIKLFIIASTIPAVINLFLGMLGLAAFTSIVYNFLTPLIAFMIFRKVPDEDKEQYN